MKDDRTPTPPRPDIPAEITARTLSQRLARGEPLVVLDVRRPEERAFCAIDVPTTAVDVFIPMDEIPARLAEVREARQRGRSSSIATTGSVRGWSPTGCSARAFPT